MARPHAIVRFATRATAAGPAADSQGGAFPEQAFPAPRSLAAEYERLRLRGYAAMARKRVVITGLARNLEAILPLTIQRLSGLMALFADARVVVFENDSADRTKPILRDWAAADRRVHAVSEDADDPVNPMRRCLARVARMARYRARCHEVVLGEHAAFDAVVVVDFDVRGGWSEDGIATSFAQQEKWDFVGANGIIFRRQGLQVNELRQYDSWALRFDAALTPIPAYRLAGIAFERGSPLQPVTSCFGGLGIYSMPAYAAGNYFHGAEDCEHVRFHRSLIEAGHRRLFLNPSQIVLYGRRHRSADGYVRRLLQAWGTMTGRGCAEWQFAERQLPVRTAARTRRAA